MTRPGWRPFIVRSHMHMTYHWMALGMMAVSAFGCTGDRGVIAMSVPPERTLGAVTAGPKNIVLAVGGTAQLTMTAVSLTGLPLTDFDSVVYRPATAGDSASVRVSNTGLATGVAPTGSSLQVNVLAFREGAWNGDQVLVQVTPAAVLGVTLSIQPSAGDSAKLAMGVAKTILPVVRNAATGQSVSGLQLQYTVRPEDRLRVGGFSTFVRIRDVFNAFSKPGSSGLSPATRNQIVSYVGEGTAWIYAIAHVYGTLLQDSVLYTFTYPYTGSVRATKTNLAVMTTLDAGQASGALTNPEILLAPGGTVTFSNGLAATDPLTVVFTFDNPAAATVAIPPSTTGGASGNVTTLIGGQSSNRRFLTPGTYHWTRVAVGGPAPWNGQTATGAIVVK